MKNEKILKSAILKETELDNVAGGTLKETCSDAYELASRGLFHSCEEMKQALKTLTPIMDIIHKHGYKGYKASMDPNTPNVYTDQNGNKIDRYAFWRDWIKFGYGL